MLWIHLPTKQTLTSFTVEPFNTYFEDLMWLFTHLWRLDEQDRRLKISLSWHLTSSLKTLTVELNILTFFVLLLNLQQILNDYFAHKNLRLREFLILDFRLKLAWFRSSLVVWSALHTRTSTSGAAEQFYLIDPNIDKVFRHDVWSQLALQC
jgi:hypothetical protein